VAAAVVNPPAFENPMKKVDPNAQVNFREQLDFIRSVSKPDVKDQSPVYPDEPVEHALEKLVC
jgi:hypothetical protein